jgi:5-methylcytosine-specific restriction endonuclease McrA
VPTTPAAACRQQGCPRTTRNGFCDEHRRERYRAQDEQRGTSTERGYTGAYRVLRLQAFARDEWRCIECGWEPDLVKLFRRANAGFPAAHQLLEELRIRHNAGDVHLHCDHRIPIEERANLRLSLPNLQTLCSSCHARKTLRESVSR